MLTGEQLVEQNTEGVNVGSGGDRTTGDLLGRRVGEGERALAFAGEDRCHDRRRTVFEQLGDSEVEQLHPTIVADEDVRRLDVAVDDQVGVGVRHRRQHLQEQLDSRLEVEPVLVAIGIDGLPLDVFEHQVGLAVDRDSGVDEVGDVGMGEPGEKAAFALESLLGRASEKRHVEELYRRAPLEAAITPPRHPDRAHAAPADR